MPPSPETQCVNLDPHWIHLIADLLHEHDPMNTCCNANEGMEDEYQGEARDIVRHLCEGVPLREAVTRTFDQWFWEGCTQTGRRKERFDALLESLITIT